MRILILSQYFTPELTAGAARIHAFAEGLARRGHEVEVVCEVPNHPSGVVQLGYGGRLVDRRRLDGFGASYVWVPASPRKTTSRRLANYAAFMASGALAGALRSRADVIVASSPPLPVGVAGLLVAVAHRRPWVLDVRDLWPDAAVAVGELRGEAPIRAAQALERRLYASAAAIVTPSEASMAVIEERTAGAADVHLITSGTTAEWLEVGDADADPAARPAPEGVFAWTYAGNLGLAQDLRTAIDAAALLGESFRLVLAGDGPLREALAARAAEVAPGLVTFTGLVPRPEAARLMRASDALLVSLADSPGIAYAVPSKLYDCCAVGRPVVVAASGEAARIAREHSIALHVGPGDPEALAAAVRRLRDDEPARSRLVAAAREFARANLRESQVGRLEAVLRSVAASRA